jgi:hypothetical protein
MAPAQDTASCVRGFCQEVGLFGAMDAVEQLCALLLSCGFSVQEVSLLLRVTRCYHQRLCVHLDNFSRFSEEELVHVVLVEAFICHCVFFDASCPLKYWFNALFADYVKNLAELNAAVARLVQIEPPSSSLLATSYAQLTV